MQQHAVVTILGTSGDRTEDAKWGELSGTAKVITEESLVETALTLSTGQQDALSAATGANGKCILRIAASADAGSNSIPLDKLEGSFDGTNYVQIQSLSITITADGENHVQITNPIVGYSKIRLSANGGTYTAAISLLAQLICIWDQ